MPTSARCWLRWPSGGGCGSASGAPSPRSRTRTTRCATRSWPSRAPATAAAASCASRTSTSARSWSARSRPSGSARRSTRSSAYCAPIRRSTRRSARTSRTTSTSRRRRSRCTCTATRCATGSRGSSSCSAGRSSSRRRSRRSTWRSRPRRRTSAARRPGSAACPTRAPDFGRRTACPARAASHRIRRAMAPEDGGYASDQPTAPYLDAVVAYAFRGPGRYHVPGHKGGPGADPGVRKAIGVDGLAADVPQDIHGIDLGPSPTPYERAERLAAEAYGAERSLFLTNGATQGNHALCLALAPLGTRIVAQRNSHASIVDGLVLSGGLPSFVAPEYDDERGITHCVTPAALERALRDAPDAKAAFIVSPTYFGMAADVAGLARVAHAAGVPLVVDQSWGPHFGFHDDLPPTALSQGADVMLTSTHKIAGSLTQSAMLHVSGERIDVGAVARAMRLLRSTSPSSLLLASLDA